MVLPSSYLHREPSNEVVQFILKKSKPLNVVFIERIRNLGPLRNLHWVFVCLLITIVLSMTGLPWVIIGLSQGPSHPITYLLGYVVCATVLFVSLAGSVKLYEIAQEWLPPSTGCLVAASKSSDLTLWLERFSVKNQMATTLLVGVLGALICGLTAIALDKTDAVPVVFATLGGYVMGLAAGNGTHYFINLPDVTSLILTNNFVVYNLCPSESAGLHSLVQLGIQFAFVGAAIGTSSLFTMLLYLRFASSSILGLVPAFLAALFIWSMELIPLNRSIGTITKFISLEKNKTLAKLQASINGKYQLLDPSDKDVLADLDKYLKLYDSVKSSSTWPIEINSTVRIIIGFVVPLIPTFIGRLFS